METTCPGCLAQIRWEPGQDALACPYCGTTTAGPERADVVEIREYPLQEAASKLEAGYGAATVSVGCEGCGAIHDVTDEVAATSCPFCGAHQLVEPLAEPVIRPESVLPFAIDREHAIRSFRGWLSGKWFRPGALTSEAQIASITGIYVPAWTFDATARSRWQAEAGYRETRSVQEKVVVDGREVTRAKSVSTTRWEPAEGGHELWYDDWLVLASSGLDQMALRGLQPFELAALRPYAPEYLAGFRAERYGIPLQEAWALAQDELGQQERAACRALVPGDTQRHLRVQTEFEDVHYKHTLLPVWCAAYQYRGQVYRYLVNGHSGKATGDAPLSAAKVAAAIALLVLIVLTCAGLLTWGGMS